MGRNGIRVGDWVEINGVAGEVIEINLFRTTILENSAWAEKGHPTGRRATFINNFAVTGQFFNFSTVGQWMWDEISVSLPSEAETYAKVALIHKAVIEETREDARLAEQEWEARAAAEWHEPYQCKLVGEHASRWCRSRSPDTLRDPGIRTPQGAQPTV